jgi:flagellar FliL protein
MAAKEEAPPPAGEVAAPAKKGKLKLIIIILVVVVVLLAGALVAFLLLTKPAPEAEHAAPAQKAKAVELPAPMYMPIDAFTVNLISETGDQYLQLGLTFDMSSAEASDKAKTYMPKIRNDLTVHLASQKPSELGTKEGKAKLAEEIRVMVNKTLDPALSEKPAGGAVREVLFTSFIIQ